MELFPMGTYYYPIREWYTPKANFLHTEDSTANRQSGDCAVQNSAKGNRDNNVKVALDRKLKTTGQENG